MSLDGRELAHPPLRGNVLWLAEEPREAVQAEADSLTVWVGRRVIDSVPTTVESVLELAVSGTPREVRLPGVLLEGMTPVTVNTVDRGDGTLPVQLQADGSLRAQVRSGFYRVHVLSRAPGVLDSLAAPDNTPASEQREIWAFDSQPHLRVAVAEGPVQVDPSQSPLDIGREEWARLPQYLLEPGQVMRLEERSRGLRPDEGNHLVLERTWWLDFDGDGLHVQDAISGQMRHGWRLDLAPPYTLESARDRERDAQLLVTGARDSKTAGIEVRDPSPSLLTHARLDGTGALPVAGWNQAMDEVHGTLVLPPGWKLWGAPGAETAQGTWWARWTLLDLFLVLITTVLLHRLLGWRGAVVGGVLLALSWHEADGVFLPLLAVLLLVLAHQALPEGSVRRVTGVVRNALALVLALGALLFAAEQARLALYPQLGGFPVFGATSAPASVMAPAPPPAVPAASDEIQIIEHRLSRTEVDAAEPALEKVQVTGSRISMYELVSLVPEDARL
ncbi:MAG: hypothetical protein R3233_12650, partial [Xanthomonadales bacterium]|nr:hypothetical protein [Xanthomonadales bacterium]